MKLVRRVVPVLVTVSENGSNTDENAGIGIGECTGLRTDPILGMGVINR